MKSKRHARILELIAASEIDTQEALQQHLREEGFDVTQATVSRDIRELRLVKTALPGGRYRYLPPATADRQMRYEAIFAESIVSLDCASHIAVIKCRTGMANAACAALDLMALPDIVGTIAGDDTIFVLMRSEQAAVRFVAELQKLTAGR